MPPGFPGPLIRWADWPMPLCTFSGMLIRPAAPLAFNCFRASALYPVFELLDRSRIALTSSSVSPSRPFHCQDQVNFCRTPAVRSFGSHLFSHGSSSENPSTIGEARGAWYDTRPLAGSKTMRWDLPFIWSSSRSSECARLSLYPMTYVPSRNFAIA
jgi:hypothetical protein